MKKEQKVIRNKEILMKKKNLMKQEKTILVKKFLM